MDPCGGFHRQAKPFHMSVALLTNPQRRIRRAVRLAREAARLGAAVVRERVETGLIFNPILARNLRDPYPMYRQLRERDPIHRSYAVRGWVLFRHADALSILRDPRFSADDRHYVGY